MTLIHRLAKAVSFGRRVSLPVVMGALESIPLEKNLRFLSLLNDGWMRGSGKKPTALAVSNASLIALEMRKLRLSQLEYSPSEDGGIMVTAIAGKKMIDVICHPIGNYDYFVEVSDVEISSDTEVAFGAVLQILQEQTCHYQNLSVFSTPITTVRDFRATTALPSRTRQVVEPRSLMQCAREQRQVTFAHT